MYRKKACHYLAFTFYMIYEVKISKLILLNPISSMCLLAMPNHITILHRVKTSLRQKKIIIHFSTNDIMHFNHLLRFKKALKMNNKSIISLQRYVYSIVIATLFTKAVNK